MAEYLGRWVEEVLTGKNRLKRHEAEVLPPLEERMKEHNMSLLGELLLKTGFLEDMEEFERAPDRIKFVENLLQVKWKGSFVRLVFDIKSRFENGEEVSSVKRKKEKNTKKSRNKPPLPFRVHVVDEFDQHRLDHEKRCADDVAREEAKFFELFNAMQKDIRKKRAGKRVAQEQKEKQGWRNWKSNQRRKREMIKRDLEFEMTFRARDVVIQGYKRFQQEIMTRENIESFQKNLKRAGIDNDEEDVEIMKHDDPRSFQDRVEEDMKSWNIDKYLKEIKQRRADQLETRKLRDQRRRKAAVEHAAARAQVEDELKKKELHEAAEKQAHEESEREEKSRKRKREIAEKKLKSMVRSKQLEDQRHEEFMQILKSRQGQVERIVYERDPEAKALKEVERKQKHFQVAREVVERMIGLTFEVCDRKYANKNQLLSIAEWRKLKHDFISGENHPSESRDEEWKTLTTDAVEFPASIYPFRENVLEAMKPIENMQRPNVIINETLDIVLLQSKQFDFRDLRLESMSNLVLLKEDAGKAYLEKLKSDYGFEILSRETYNQERIMRTGNENPIKISDSTAVDETNRDEILLQHAENMDVLLPKLVVYDLTRCEKPVIVANIKADLEQEESFNIMRADEFQLPDPIYKSWPFGKQLLRAHFVVEDDFFLDFKALDILRRKQKSDEIEFAVRRRLALHDCFVEKQRQMRKLDEILLKGRRILKSESKLPGHSKTHVSELKQIIFQWETNKTSLELLGSDLWHATFEFIQAARKTFINGWKNDRSMLEEIKLEILNEFTDLVKLEIAHREALRDSKTEFKILTGAEENLFQKGQQRQDFGRHLLLQSISEASTCAESIDFFLKDFQSSEEHHVFSFERLKIIMDIARKLLSDVDEKWTTMFDELDKLSVKHLHDQDNKIWKLQKAVSPSSFDFEEILCK